MRISYLIRGFVVDKSSVLYVHVCMVREMLGLHRLLFEITCK